MAISQAMCTSFKKELLEGVHNFKNSGGNDFKLALYTSSASLDAATTAYTTSNEASGTNYTAKGSSLTRVDPTTSSTTAFTDFADLTFSSATITANGALIFNDTASEFLDLDEMTFDIAPSFWETGLLTFGFNKT